MRIKRLMLSLFLNIFSMKNASNWKEHVVLEGDTNDGVVYASIKKIRSFICI